MFVQTSHLMYKTKEPIVIGFLIILASNYNAGADPGGGGARGARAPP